MIRVPPHDLDAEAAVLSAIFLASEGRPKENAIDVAIALGLQPEDFYSEAHRRIFEAAVALHAVGQPTDVVQVGTWLKDRERIGQVGGMPYLAEILNAAPAVTSVAAYVTTVLKKARVRSMIAVCQTISAEGYLDVGDELEWLDRSEQRVHEVARTTLGSKDSFGHIRDALKRGVASVMSARGGISGVPTGLLQLDRMTGGLQPGELWIVAGRPGMGKTAFAMGVAANVSRPLEDASPPANASLVATIEMPSSMIALRAMCSDAGVSVADVRAGRASQAQWSRLIASGKELGSAAIFLDERSGPTLSHLRASIRRAAREAGRTGANLRLVVVDYLQLMRGGPAKGTRDANREQEIATISRGLKELAKDFSVTVMALSQLNRSTENRADKRPLLSDLRESGAIEQDADVVVLLFRENYYGGGGPQPTRGSNVAELIVAKQRNGPTGTIRARFDQSATRYENLADEEV